MKRYGEDSLFDVTTTKTALKIEIKLKDLEFLLEESPNNLCPAIKVKCGKREELADFIANYITETEDPDTGDNPLMQMLENAFYEIFEGAEDFCIYPEE